MIMLFFAAYASAQTADEIIAKYVQVLGGKDQLSKINSVYTENKIEVMGMEGTGKSTILNGKGNRQDIEIMGTVITSCYTDKGGWSVNPMTGGGTPETMSDTQYNAGKESIVIGAPFINYAEKGFKAELLDDEAVDSVPAHKIKLTSPDNISTIYFFDTDSGYLIKSISQVEMQGMMTDNEMRYSMYRQADGFAMPYKVDMVMAGGQFTMTNTVTKVELNKPVDETFFAKP